MLIVRVLVMYPVCALYVLGVQCRALEEVIGQTLRDEDEGVPT